MEASIAMNLKIKTCFEYACYIINSLLHVTAWGSSGGPEVRVWNWSDLMKAQTNDDDDDDNTSTMGVKDIQHANTPNCKPGRLRDQLDGC